MTTARIKVCCISSIDEALVAIAAGVDAIGLVSHMPSGPGVIEESLIARIIERVRDSDVDTFMLTSARHAEAIIAQHARCPANTLQLVDEIEAGELRALRERLPDVRLVQVVHVMDERAITQATQVEALVDGILLDSGNPTLAIKTLGGTGKVHDWRIAAKVVEALDKPVWLAGGLRASNVARAITQVKPWGVDVCSGVRTEDELDTEKLEAFIREVRMSSSA